MHLQQVSIDTNFYKLIIMYAVTLRITESTLAKESALRNSNEANYWAS